MLMIIAVTAVIFTGLALMNWNRMIGAGPTILIVGSLFMIAFVGVSYSSYLYDLRTYDACVDRHYRLTDQYKFNNKIVDIVNREMNARQDIVIELSNAITLPFDISECGTEPTFLDGD